MAHSVQRGLQDPGGGGGIDALGAARAAHVVVVDHGALDRGGRQALVLQQRRQIGETHAGLRRQGREIGDELARRLSALEKDPAV